MGRLGKGSLREARPATEIASLAQLQIDHQVHRNRRQ